MRAKWFLLYLGLHNPDARPLSRFKRLKRPKRALKGRTTSNPRLGPQRGLRKAPRGLYGHGMDKQTFGGLRTPACGWTPTGAGPTASPLRGFGHLLAMIGDRNPAPSRDAAITSIPGFKRFKTRYQVGAGQGQGRPIGPGAAFTLDACPARTCSVAGVGCFTPPLCHVASAPEAGRRRFCVVVLPCPGRGVPTLRA